MRLVLGALVAAWCAAGTANAGVVVTMEMADSGDKPKTNVMYIEPDRLKMSGEHGDMIYRGDLGKVWMLHAADHTYREMTPESMQKMRSRMEGAMAQMQDRLKSLPEAQRKQIEAMMAQNGGGPGAAKAMPLQVTYEKAGGSKTVGQWSCTPYTMKIGADTQDEICVAKLADIGVTRDDLKAFIALGAFMRNMAPNGAGRDGAYDFDGLSKGVGFDGLPVQSVHGTGEDKVVNTVKSVDRKSIPADTFELPAGYKKMEMMGGRAGPPPQDGE